MDYKGYGINSVEAELLYDILQTQQEILAELRKSNNVDAEDENIGLTENEPEEIKLEETGRTSDDIDIDGPKQTETTLQEQYVHTKKPENQRKPAQHKPVKKKTQSKKASSKKA